MPKDFNKLKHLIKNKHKLDENGKRKLLHALRLYKEIQDPMMLEGNLLDPSSWSPEETEALKFIGMAFGVGALGSIAGRLTRDLRKKLVEKSKLLKAGQIKLDQFREYVKSLLSTDITLREDDETNGGEERNVVAKTFDTKSDFDSYVNQRRGIEMTPQEQQSILNYKEAKPTQQDKFFVKYETTDDFGNNTTTVIKKLKEGNQFCWTAFAKHETAEEEGKPEGSEEGGLKEQAPAPTNQPQEQPQEDEITVDDPIRITKSITFVDETEGAKILSDFLRKLEI
jgi:hypothetical protein